MLTGGGAFVDPSTGVYSEKLANACDLAFLRLSSAWESVRDRPKSFVESLLLLDENKRMTATQALRHEWFANDAHKTNFEDLYRRTIRHWRCRAPRRDVLEFRDAAMVQNIVLSRSSGFSPSRRIRGDDAVEAHCRPVPKKVYSILYPRKKSGFSMASEEVRQAIRGWLANSNGPDVFEADDDEEDGSRAQQSKRHKLLRSDQGGPKLPASRSQRSGSAPPQLTSSPYFQSERQSNVDKTRDSLRREEQILRFRDTHKPVSAPSDHGSASFLRSTARGHGKQPAIPASISVKDFAESSALKDIHDSTSEPQVMFSAIPRSVQSVSAHNGQAPAPGQNLALDLSAPIRTKGLKRWNSSTLSDAGSSRSSSKRHRGSIFDIAEDEEIELSPSHKHEVERIKKVRFPHNMDIASEDNEEDAEEDDITLPHHPASARVEGTLNAAGHLYLPR
jgi:hypothetical protein